MTWWFVYEWEKNLTAKTPSGDFQVTTLETPLLSLKRLQARNPKYLTNLQLNPYPNTQSDWFCSESFPFWCTTPSTWLTVAWILVRDFKTPIWKDCWLQSSSVHPHNEDQEDAWSENPTVQIHSNFFKRKRWTRLRTLSPVTICLNRVCSMLVQLVYRFMALKTILLYV